MGCSCNNAEPPNFSDKVLMARPWANSQVWAIAKKRGVDSWMYPDPNVPLKMGNPYIAYIAVNIVDIYGLQSPGVPRLNTKYHGSTRTWTLGVHPSGCPLIYSLEAKVIQHDLFGARWVSSRDPNSKVVVGDLQRIGD